jgi:hypothetical protein
MKNLADLKALLGIKTLTLSQWKDSGSYMATVEFNGVATNIFTTKKSGKNINDKSPLQIIGGKIFIGDMAEAKDTITV